MNSFEQLKRRIYDGIASIKDLIPIISELISLKELGEESFSQTLQFNKDKELRFSDGETLSFTLSANDNINGTGIILKLNAPVSVAFSSDFEAAPNSQDFDVTKMNLVTLVYFSNFDGNGNRKVVYNNLQLTLI